jgi:hypothetical protein
MKRMLNPHMPGLKHVPVEAQALQIGNSQEQEEGKARKPKADTRAEDFVFSRIRNGPNRRACIWLLPMHWVGVHRIEMEGGLGGTFGMIRCASGSRTVGETNKNNGIRYLGAGYLTREWRSGERRYHHLQSLAATRHATIFQFRSFAHQRQSSGSLSNRETAIKTFMHCMLHFNAQFC